MPINSKDDLLAFCSVDYEEIEIPGVEGTLRIRSMSAAERKAIVGKLNSDGSSNVDPWEVQLRTIAKSLVDEDGKRIFADNDKAQISQLPARVVDAIAAAVTKLNGFDQLELKEDLGETQS